VKLVFIFFHPVVFFGLRFNGRLDRQAKGKDKTGRAIVDKENKLDIIFISWLLFSTSTRRLLGYVILFHFIFIFSSRVFCFIFFSFTTRREPFDSVPVPERRVAEKI
jgi:hypothetical protein